MASFIITGEGLTLFHEGETFQVLPDHPKWTEIMEAIHEEDWEEAAQLANPIKAVAEYVNGTFAVRDRRVWLNKDTEMHGALAERIVEMHEQGFPLDPMVRFIGNLNTNPSNRAVQELYKFLEATELPITNDGHFMAYKRVDTDFKDQYTHTIDNSPGQVVEMPRNEVNDDCRQTCSHGLHFAGRSYITQYAGAKLVAIKINPRDVVSIPADYNNAKGRCCRYEVIAELDLSKAINGEEAFTAAVYEAPEPPTPEPVLAGDQKYSYGTGTTRCAHCKAIIWGGELCTSLDRGDHVAIVHKTCEVEFLNDQDDSPACPTCVHCKMLILTTQSSLGVGDNKVVHSGCYNAYRSNRDGSGS